MIDLTWFHSFHFSFLTEHFHNNMSVIHIHDVEFTSGHADDDHVLQSSYI